MTMLRVSAACVSQTSARWACPSSASVADISRRASAWTSSKEGSAAQAAPGGTSASLPR